ncbi:hypothetical protein AB0M29_13695 [Streptomyces sp. NPDC051976]|uniref:hypothetical protein n=1 Tax=Streptomyces sp. NPDC051976 TaxID=3154947 RepID=UPI0034122F19
MARQVTIQAEGDVLGAEQAAAAASAAAAKEEKEGLVGRIVSLVGDLIGVNDAISCVTEGDVMGCINTGLTAVPLVGALQKPRKSF